MTDLSRYNGNDSIYQNLGRLEATVEAHASKLEEISNKLDTLIDASNRIKGGWGVMSILIGIAAAAGAFSHNMVEAIKRAFFG